MPIVLFPENYFVDFELWIALQQYCMNYIIKDSQ